MNLTKQHPNPHTTEDRNKVRLAAGIFFVFAFLQAGIAALILANQGNPEIKPEAIFLAKFLAVEGALNAIFGLGTLSNRSGFALAGSIVMGFGLIGTASNLIAFLLRFGAFAGVWRGYKALADINSRIEKPQQDNPLTAYYHALLPLLVRVMQADGHVDEREKKKIREICNAIDLSAYEKEYLLRKAIDSPSPSIEELVSAYLEAEERLWSGEFSNEIASVDLMVAVSSVAAADGIFVPEEMALIRQIGKCLNYSEERIASFIEQQKSTLADVNVKNAPKILGIAENASKEEREEAYATLTKLLQEEHFEHIGTALTENAKLRLRVIEKAYDVLTTSRPG